MAWNIERDGDGAPCRLLFVAESVADQIAQRQTRNEAVRELFLSHPAKWISVKQLARVGGFAAWRSRVAEVRIALHESDAGTIQWNGNAKDSRYRYLKQKPLGPDAAVPRERRLF
jgi:hypothetical protein